MTQLSIDNTEDLNESPPEPRIQSRALEVTKPATGKGFSFIKMYGDKNRTHKYIDYKPAKIYDKGVKWFVWFSFRNPETKKFERFKVYEGINTIPDLEEKKEFAKDLQTAVNIYLKEGNSPFDEEKFEVIKTWTVNQSLAYFKQKIPDMGIRPKTIQSYESFIQMFQDELRLNTNIESLTKQHCQTLLTNLKTKRNWSNTTYNNGLTFGRLLFSYLIQHGITKENPFKQIKPLPENKTKNQPFSDETFELIKKKASPTLLRFLMFLYHTGCRPNEARQLKYEHILRDRKLLFIPGKLSKGKKDGFVPISDSFLQMFPPSEGFIFGTGRNHFSHKFKLLADKLGLNKNQTLYSIKATRAVHLARDGASPYSIQQLFRHSSLDMTQIYLRDLGIMVNTEAADKVR